MFAGVTEEFVISWLVAFVIVDFCHFTCFVVTINKLTALEWVALVYSKGYKARNTAFRVFVVLVSKYQFSEYQQHTSSAST